jgi:hypothetical protein
MIESFGIVNGIALCAIEFLFGWGNLRSVAHCAIRLVESLHFNGFHKIVMHEVQQNARNEMEKCILMYEVQLNVLLGSEELSRQVSWCGAACYAGVVGEWNGAECYAGANGELVRCGIAALSTLI